MSYTFESPFQYIPKSEKFGTVGLGKLYIGVVNGNPGSTPADRIQAYIARQGLSDLAISQPIDISAGGVPTYQGAPVTIKVNSAYSCAVLDHLGAQVYYSPSSGDEITEFTSIDLRLDSLEAKSIQSVETFAALATTPAPAAGMIVYLKQHTSGGVGGGHFLDTVGTITNNGGTLINNTVTAGRHWKRINYSTVIPQMFGAVPLSVMDQTTVINKFLAFLSESKISGDGQKNTFYITSGIVGSNTTLRDINFVTLAGSADFVAPLTFDGQVSPIVNCLLENVNVNGNRQNQTAIISPAEDGGRHGVRMLGAAENITFRGCSFTYCAGDGAEIFSVTPAASDDIFKFKNIYFENCDFSWNRRHGLSLDCFDGVVVLGGRMQNNGLDLDLVSALDSGMRGARYLGNLYGRSFDAEDYGVGTGYRNFIINGAELSGNVAGFLFHSSTNVAAVGFVTRRNLYVINCTMSLLSNPTTNPSASLYNSTATVAVPCFENVVIDNNIFDGYLYSIGVRGLTVDSALSKYYAGNLYYAAVGNCSNYNIKRYEPQQMTITPNPFSVVVSTTTPGVTLGGDVQTIFDVSDKNVIRIAGEFTTTGTGLVVIDLTDSATLKNIRVLNLSGNYSASGTPMLTDYGNVAYNVIRLLLVAPAAGLHAYQLLVRAS